MKAKFTIYPYWGKTHYFVLNVESIDHANKIAKKIAKNKSIEQCGYEIIETNK